MQQAPIMVLDEGTTREKGKNARTSNLNAARAIGDAVRTTLGPRGMDKMLVDSLGDVVVTNDGATILSELDVEHPAAKMAVEVAETQDQECGDGTTTAVVLAGELLHRAEDLVDDVHPTKINEGYRLAYERAVEAIEDIARESDEETLEHVARTAMASKAAAEHADALAPLAVDAILHVAEQTPGGWRVDTDHVQVTTQEGGSVEDTRLLEGILLNKDRVHSGMPEGIDDAKIALLDEAIEVEETEADAQIQLTDPDQLQSFLDEEEKLLREKVDKLTSAGANVVLCQKGIADLAQHFLAQNGVYAIRRVKKSDMEKLARATGARIVNDVDDIAEDDLGSADTVEERALGDGTFTFVTGCPDASAVSLLVRGGTQHVIDEAERTFEDALRTVASALEDGQVVPGGGAPEVEAALRLHEYANKVGGREQLAIEAFAEALETIPRTLAENAGLDAIETLVDLKSEHETAPFVGVDPIEGTTADMAEKNVFEPFTVKEQALASASDVASMILRIDDVIAAEGSDDDAPEAGGAGGMPGMGAGAGMPGM